MRVVKIRYKGLGYKGLGQANNIEFQGTDEGCGSHQEAPITP